MDYSQIEIFSLGQAIATLISLSCLLLLNFFADELHRNSWCHRQFQD